MKAVFVYARLNAVMYQAMRPDNPQTDVIKLNDLAGWIATLHKNESLHMLKEDHEEIVALTGAYQRHMFPPDSHSEILDLGLD